MTEKHFTVLGLINSENDLKEPVSLHLRCIGGRKGLTRRIKVPDLNRPGLALSGFYDSFAYDRVQLFGKGEVAYLRKLELEGKTQTIKHMFTYPIPCCTFSHSLSPDRNFLEEAERNQCPILQTDLTSTEFHARLMQVLTNVFAPSQTLHGVLVEVYGLGILLMGESGVGKSEIALELVKHGHRLVADDTISIRCIHGNNLIGSGSTTMVGHHMEIRGLGIINITRLFGVRAIRERKEIQLVVNLEEWNSQKNYDRLGTNESYTELLGVRVPKLEIPVKPGRNIPIIIESAAMNERLKKMGYHSAREFNQNILRWTESDSSRAVYFDTEDII
ncbi:MAG: HPr(Ser) kinase/phosphatase [Treponema sp.]|jgi:HPr kinase/phosphorylase|nr:HPr(Ser) kinase/phosphatase [Treponema sp.]